jgi:hypothetical protein
MTERFSWCLFSVSPKRNHRPLTRLNFSYKIYSMKMRRFPLQAFPLDITKFLSIIRVKKMTERFSWCLFSVSPKRNHRPLTRLNFSYKIYSMKMRRFPLQAFPLDITKFLSIIFIEMIDWLSFYSNLFNIIYHNYKDETNFYPNLLTFAENFVNDGLLTFSLKYTKIER